MIKVRNWVWWFSAEKAEVCDEVAEALEGKSPDVDVDLAENMETGAKSMILKADDKELMEAFAIENRHIIEKLGKRAASQLNELQKQKRFRLG